MQSPAPSCQQPLGASRHLAEQPLILEAHEFAEEMPLLALPLGIAEARDHGAAVEHHRGVGGEHHVRQARHALHDGNAGAGMPECGGELALRLARGGPVLRLVRPPGFGRHPRVNLV